MKNLQGVYTALVTPYRNGGVDYEALNNIIELQIKGKVAGIVPVGTTGESPTLSCEEHLKVIEFTVEKVAGRIPVIAGTGSNDTAYSLELSQYAKEVGADAHLWQRAAVLRGAVPSAGRHVSHCIMTNSLFGMALLPFRDSLNNPLLNPTKTAGILHSDSIS